MSNRNFAAALLATVYAAASAAPADGLRISTPFTHENLSIYLLHASGKQSATNLLTLREAMEQKKAAVYETGTVQQLSIENLSDRPVFVQAGDIVKGGKQDRVLTTDLGTWPGRKPGTLTFRARSAAILSVSVRTVSAGISIVPGTSGVWAMATKSKGGSSRGRRAAQSPRMSAEVALPPSLRVKS